jgi:hypothetical protein
MHTIGPYGACPPPAPVGEGGRAARAAQRVLVVQGAAPKAHTWAARHALSASAGWGGWPRRAGGSARARPAAIAMRRRRHSCGPHGARPQPASPGEGGRVARAGQRVPDLPHSRRSADGRHMGRTVHAGGTVRVMLRGRDTREPHEVWIRQRRMGRAVASSGRRSACPSRRDRDASPAVHT